MRGALEYCADLPLKRYDTGSVLLNEGSRSGQLIVLREGILEVVRGELVVSRINEPGAILGEISVLIGVPHTTTVRAASPVAVHIVADPEGFMRAHPPITMLLARGLAVRLNAATTFLVDVNRQYAGRAHQSNLISNILDVMTFNGNSFEFALDFGHASRRIDLS